MDKLFGYLGMYFYAQDKIDKSCRKSTECSRTELLCPSMPNETDNMNDNIKLNPQPVEENKNPRMSEEENPRQCSKEHWVISATYEKKTIRHLVFSGGALGGFVIYGALKALHDKGLWQMNNIQTVWGTSVGSLLAVSVALKYDWETLDDYLIKRPWNSVVKMDFFRLIDKSGFMGREVFRDIVVPLLAGKGLEENTTLSELFAFSGIEVNIFTTELIFGTNDFHSVRLSHKTHPDWKVVDAVYASSCFPLLFEPFRMVSSEPCRQSSDGSDDPAAAAPAVQRLFLDGGILAAFPYNYCVSHGEGVLEEEVMGIYLSKWVDEVDATISTPIYGSLGLGTFIKSFSSAVFNYTDKTGRKPPKPDSKSCLVMLQMNMSDRYKFKILESEKDRREYIFNGHNNCLEYLARKKILVEFEEKEKRKKEGEGVVEIPNNAEKYP